MLFVVLIRNQSSSMLVSRLCRRTVYSNRPMRRPSCGCYGCVLGVGFWGKSPSTTRCANPQATRGKTSQTVCPLRGSERAGTPGRTTTCTVQVQYSIIHTGTRTYCTSSFVNTAVRPGGERPAGMQIENLRQRGKPKKYAVPLFHRPSTIAFSRFLLPV